MEAVMAMGNETVTTVVNRKSGAHYDVFIGRPSVFGNPFRIGEHGNRVQVIEMYEQYARQRLKEDAQFREAVKGLYGKRLGCYCVPLKCHGTVLARLAEELNR
jgi:hypothetical protein